MQKDANLVELEKCCQTHIFLQNFVLIQPRTRPPKICKILQKIENFANSANPNPVEFHRSGAAPGPPAPLRAWAPEVHVLRLLEAEDEGPNPMWVANKDAG